ncbi:hypothetical protein [Brevundimonas sp.]|uniref:hypothetical protein n=1 Tax=Brevundimonas sp. TaxID=1871086 RepID=UPI0019A76232|nr:hypothetical protein [Brevundimonas sp.]MBD3837008.1 hypothetical protein [Brevundimonas sp.]
MRFFERGSPPGKRRPAPDMDYHLTLRRQDAAPRSKTLRVSNVVAAYDRCRDLLEQDANLRAVELFHHGHLLHTLRPRPADPLR